MSKVLIMLTMTYPYDAGNNFLAGEYETINNTYDKIIVFCLATNQNNKINHPLSEKWVVLRREDQQNIILRRIKYLLPGIKKIKQKKLREEIRTTSSISAKLMAIYYYGRLENYWNFIKKNICNIKLNSSDEVVIYSFWLLQTAQCAGLLKKHLKEKFQCKTMAISRAHGYDLYEYRYKANYLPFRKSILQKLDFVYPCSYDGTKYLQKKYPEYKDKIKYSYLGTCDRGLNKLPSNNNVFVIASCSSIITIKRMQLIAKALVILEKHGITNLQWFCIGEGNLKQELVDYCKKNISQIQVQLLGYLPNERLFEFYRQQHIDAFINVSSTEGLPVSIMEAQSMGIPVIATDVGGTSEIVNSDNGILIDNNPTPQEVANAIMEFKNMPQSAILIKRKNARTNWELKFCAKKNYKLFHSKLSNSLTGEH